MTTNPFFNAILASGYIVGIVLFIQYVLIPSDVVEPSILIPIMMLSLLTLSVAVMGFLFFKTPLEWFLAGQKEKAVRLFLQTVGIFALITALVIAALLFAL